MADNDVIKEPLPSFDIGMEESAIFGNISAADEFLSGKEVTSSSDDIEEIEVVKKPVKKVAPVKKQEEEEEEEVSGQDLVENFLEEKEKEEEEEETEVTLKKKEPVKTEESTFKVLSEELYSAGIFTTEEGEEPVFADTPEEFLELFNKEKTKGVSNVLENFLSKHGDDRRELFEAIFVKGVDPNKYLPVFNEVQNFEGLDLEIEGNQEKVIRSYYTRAGWDKAKVDTKIEKLKNYAELEEEAKNVHPLLVKQDKQKLAEMEKASAEAEEEKATQDRDYKGAIAKILQEKVKTKDFDGLPLDDKTAAKAFDFLYTKKWKLPSGELLTDFDKAVLESKNADNIGSRIKMALLYMNNFDFSKIQKKAITKETNQLFHKLVKTGTKKTIIPDNSGW